MSAPVAFPFMGHRTLAVALAETFRTRRQKILWWSVPRRTERGWASDTRMARTVTIDGSEWRLEPGGTAYEPRWIIERDGTEIARTRQLAVAQQTVARAVFTKIGG